VRNGSPNDRWEDWFADPPQDDPDTERFKWGWNSADGEVIWRVGGPGDGFPAHVEELKSAWGREPSLAAGDAIGAATYVPARAPEAAVVVVDVYYEGTVPARIVDWFRSAFPDAQLRVAGGE